MGRRGSRHMGRSDVVVVPTCPRVVTIAWIRPAVGPHQLDHKKDDRVIDVRAVTRSPGAGPMMACMVPVAVPPATRRPEPSVSFAVNVTSSRQRGPDV